MVKLKNKNRLYLAVSGSGVTERNPRLVWGFLIGPKIEDKSVNPGLVFRLVRDDAGDWRSKQQRTQNVQSVAGIFARVVIAKIEDDQRMVDLLREKPAVDAGEDGSEATDSVASRRWAEDVLARLVRDGKIVGTSQLDWEKVHVTARAYVGKKAAERRYREEERMVLPTPTWDMLTSKELAP